LFEYKDEFNNISEIVEKDNCDLL